MLMPVVGLQDWYFVSY